MTSTQYLDATETAKFINRNPFFSRGPSIIKTLYNRAAGNHSVLNLKLKHSHKNSLHAIPNNKRRISNFLETKAVNHFESDYFKLSEDDTNNDNAASAVSTIALAFSSCGEFVATTHGDHTVKVLSCLDGSVKAVLRGHPRTPWTVKFHPSNPNILASGCLGFQVRVWDISKKQCSAMIRASSSIISLAFHPEGDVIAVAYGSNLMLWTYENTEPSGEYKFDSVLRSVTFLPDGKHLILGALDHLNSNFNLPYRSRDRVSLSGGIGQNEVSRSNNPTSSGTNENSTGRNSNENNEGGIGNINNNPRRAVRPTQSPRSSLGASSFYLRKFEFDHVKARDGDASCMGRTHLVLNRALLYNDGGLDVTNDGKNIATCQSLFVPEGFDFSYSDFIEQFDWSILMEYVGFSLTSSNSKFGDWAKSHEVIDTVESTPPPSMLPMVTTPPPINIRVMGSDLLNSLADDENADSQPLNSAQHTGSFDGYGNSHLLQKHSWLSAVAVNHQNLRKWTLKALVSDLNSLYEHAKSLDNEKDFNQFFLLNYCKEFFFGDYVPHVVFARISPSLTAPEPETRNIIEKNSSHKESYAYNMLSLTGHKIMVQREHCDRLQQNYAQSYLGEVLSAYPLTRNAEGVTCVKFSPTNDFLLLGYGVRVESSNQGADGGSGEEDPHSVTAFYAVRDGLDHVSTLESQVDDVNIAKFHPSSGYGVAYGTKQGKVRVLSTKTWMSQLSDDSER